MTQVHIVHAFTDHGHGGNPAGVVLDSDHLNAQQKQDIARKVGLSETAFVSRSSVATYKLEFFTPTRQIPHCGHATIATFALLHHLGRLQAGAHSKETIDGLRDIEISPDGKVFMGQLAPRYPDAPAPEDIAVSLGLKVVPGAPPIIVNTGNSFLLVEFPTSKALSEVVPDQGRIEALSEQFDLIGYYCFARQEGERQATTRMFAPRYGIAEEAATGMAAGPLGAYLYEKAGMLQTTLLIEQGHFMPVPSPSLLEVQLSVSGSNVTALKVGGYGTLTDSLEI